MPAPAAGLVYYTCPNKRHESQNAAICSAKLRIVVMCLIINAVIVENIAMFMMPAALAGSMSCTCAMRAMLSSQTKAPKTQPSVQQSFLKI